MKALFVGLGSIGQRHLRNIRQLVGDDLEVIAYRARSDSPLLGADGTVIENSRIGESSRHAHIGKAIRSLWIGLLLRLLLITIATNY